MSVPRHEGPHPLEDYPEPPPRGEDLPYDDGEPMESERHVNQMVLLIQSLNDAWRDRQDFYCGGNMFLYFSKAQSKKNDFRGPDVFVAMGVERRERRSWVVWEEDGKLPTVVIELLSPSTESTDRGEKMELYAKVLRVPIYVLYDPWTYVLEGYRLDPETLEYHPIEPDSRGLVACEPLRLWLGIGESPLDYGLPMLRWFDESGQVLHTGREEALQARTQAEHEAVRADEASLRAEEASLRAEEASLRADASKRALAEERARVAALEAKLAALEREKG